jgi:hypothetical protein
MVKLKALQQQTGQLGTRKQDSNNNDSSIDRDGMEAELVACMALLAEWIGLLKHTEIKQTRHPRGHLIIRPPKGVGYEMKEEYIDDSIYILVTGPSIDGAYTLRGWTDRAHFLSHMNKSPLGRIPCGSLECWGVRVNKLLPIESLYSGD